MVMPLGPAWSVSQTAFGLVNLRSLDLPSSKVLPTNLTGVNSRF
jgi:uncharacterized protein YceK